MRVLTLILCILLAGAAWGADASAPTQADLDKAVRELGSDQFKVRDQAFGRLLEWALADAGVLKKLPASDPDPEIQNALERLPGKVQEHILEQRKRFYREELIWLAGDDAKLKEALQGTLNRIAPETIWPAQQAVLKKGDHVLAGAWAGYLGECVLDHPDLCVRAAAVRALGALGEKSAVPQVLKLLDDAHPVVREAAVLTLGQLGEKSAGPQILKLLDDAHPNVRQMAARVLGHLGEKSVVPQVLKLLEDGNMMVRAEAVETLGHLGEKSVVPQLVKFLEDTDTSLHRSAAYALGLLGEKSVAPQLIKFLEDNDPGMRGIAATALSQLGEKSAVPQISKLLQDADSYVSKYAAEALRKLSGEKWPDDKLVDSARAWWAQHKDDAEWGGHKP